MYRTIIILCILSYDSYYEDIQKMPAISEQDMSAILKEESQVWYSKTLVPALCRRKCNGAIGWSTPILLKSLESYALLNYLYRTAQFCSLAEAVG